MAKAVHNARPRPASLGVRLDDGLHAAIRKRARSEDRTVSGMTRRLLAWAVRHYPIESLDRVDAA